VLLALVLASEVASQAHLEALEARPASQAVVALLVDPVRRPMTLYDSWIANRSQLVSLPLAALLALADPQASVGHPASLVAVDLLASVAGRRRTMHELEETSDNSFGVGIGIRQTSSEVERSTQNANWRAQHHAQHLAKGLELPCLRYSERLQKARQDYESKSTNVRDLVGKIWRIPMA
jgi:hypothetical protein